MIQCNKQNFCLSQWISATNNIDSIFYILVACDKRIVKKSKNKHNSKFEFHQRYQIALGYQNSKTQRIKLWNTQQLKLRQNSKIYKTQNKIKLNSNCDQTLKKSFCDKAQILTKLKLWQISNCDKTKNVKTKKLNLKFDKIQVVTKLHNLNCDTTQNSNCDKTQ